MWSKQPTQEKPESCNSRTDPALGSTGKSAAAALVEVAASFAAGWNGSNSGSCSQCRGYRDPRISTAQHPHVFCSAQCEKEFVLNALAAFTPEDCMRLQERLEQLLRDARPERARR